MAHVPSARRSRLCAACESASCVSRGPRPSKRRAGYTERVVESAVLEPVVDAVEKLHAEVDERVAPLVALHATRLHCRRGCAACCVDGLTVFEVEAARIRRHHAALLAQGEPHSAGACAFLDAEGGCRIYPDRPYVCRTQGLPLRWIDETPSASEDAPGEAIEMRDICPLNEDGGPAVDDLPAEECWTIGPVEERLARLEMTVDGGAGRRVALRDLFARR